MKSNRPLIIGLIVAILFFTFAMLLLASTGWLSGNTHVMWQTAAAGWEVRSGDRTLGVVADREALDAALDDLAEKLGAPGALPELVMTPVRAPSASMIGAQELADVLARRAGLGIDAAIILINSAPACAVASLEEGWQAVDAALEPWRGQERFRSVEPLGKVRVVTAIVPADRVLPGSAAANVLILGEAEARTAAARAGDKLTGFAARHGLTVGELRRANPQLIGRDALQAGEALIVTRPDGPLHVRSLAQGAAAAEASAEWRADPALYVTQTRVIDPGAHEGEALAAAEVWIDGVRVSREMIPDASKPVTDGTGGRVVAYGTRPMPQSGDAVAAGTSGFLWPVRGHVSSAFGRRWGRMHQGIDIAADLATPVMASRSGTVTYAGWRGDYGQLVEIDHGDGLVTRYGHCYGLLVAPGEKVSSGDSVALLGSTGRSTGPHLHFEVRVGGSAVDPRGKLP